MKKCDLKDKINDIDVAVIGMSGRFPGARNIAEYWENIRHGIESVTFFSHRDLEESGVDPALLNNPSYVKASSMLEDVEMFDASFFGYSPREAELMDPQCRFFLECAQEALENAGYNPQRYNRSISVYAGASMNTYLLRNLHQKLDFSGFILSSANIHTVLGNSHDFLATRVSYKLNLTGPSVDVQTACSSSLVAVHLACQSLLNCESSIALAGGVSIYLPQKAGYLYQEGMILSPDGHCRVFDAEANGTVFGRGVGVVVLKPLLEALQDRDTIYAVIKGSAINNDGSNKVGFTAPSVDGQAAVIAEAIANAGVEPETISYVEAHGTGTVQGDPIEIIGLTKAFGTSIQNNASCAIGSVKSNIGHLDAASGIAGFIKTVLMLQHKFLPPSLHFRSTNPQIDFANSPFYVNTTPTPWNKGQGPRRAGVSSFGMGGTNAHVILEEAPAVERVDAEIERPFHLLSLSAKTDKALEELVERYQRHLKEHPSQELADVCFTANAGRSHFDHRFAAVTQSVEQLREQLAAFAATEQTAGVVSGKTKSTDKPRIAFLFSGQGSQYVGMGRELYETQPTFRKALVRCDELLRAHLEKPLLSVLYPRPGEESLLDETAYTQPALFALEYALFELWRSWGIEPSVVMGHSVGEYVAACVAGVFSLEDGLKLITQRGRLIQALPKDGEMAAVFAGESQVAAAVAGYKETVSVAAVNGPENTVISGARESIEKILKELEAEGITAHRLIVSHAFHSPLMEPMLDAFEQAASEVTYSSPRLGLMSNVTGRLVAGNEVSHGAYWRRHVRAPVQFYRSMQALGELGETVFVEFGPHPVLLGMGAQCLPEGEVAWLPSLRRGRNDWDQILESLGELYVRGAKISWDDFDGDYKRRRVSLPTYPFERNRHWIECSKPKNSNMISFPQDPQRLRARHPLLENRLRTPQQIYETELNIDTIPWLREHRVHHQMLLPIAAYLEMSLAASSEGSGKTTGALKDVSIEHGLILTEKHTCTVQLILMPADGQTKAFQIYSLKENGESETNSWALVAKGKLCSEEPEFSNPENKSLEKILSCCQEEVSVDAYYEILDNQGLNLGPGFRVLAELRRGKKEALGRLKVPEHVRNEMGPYRIHPALLDGCLQVAAAAIDGHDRQTVDGRVYLPVKLESMRIYDDIGCGVWSYATMCTMDGPPHKEILADVYVLDDLGRVVVEIAGLEYRCLFPEDLSDGKEKDLAAWLYKMDWKQVSRLSESKRFSTPADFLPSLSQISESVKPELDRLSDQHGLDIYAKMAPPFNALCVVYIVNALEQMGFKFKVNHAFTTNSLVGDLGIAARHYKLTGRFLEALADAGIIVREGKDGWRIVQTPQKEDPQELWRTLSNEYAACQHELGFVAQTGMHLAESLRGKTDPLQLLFPGGDLSTSEELYKESIFARVFNSLVQKVVTTALENLPEERKVRIIEIGAGTGGTTSFILPHLPASQTEYVFTDISPLFLEKARKKFSSYSFLRYEVFDAEKDPALQGIELDSFDIVIAANVIHATRDLIESLRHIHRLLAPGGLLVSLEVTGAQLFADVTVGLLEGWWRFSDHDLRPSYPLISQSEWTTLMEKAGFSDAAAIPEISLSEGDLSQQAVLLARASLSPDDRKDIDSSGSELQEQGECLIFADRQGLGQKLAERIREKNVSSTLVFFGAKYEANRGSYTIDPCRPDDMIRLLREVSNNRQKPLKKVIHMWALDAAPLEETTPIQLKEQQRVLCGSVLHLSQALARLAEGPTPTLLLVTRGSQAPLSISSLRHPGSSVLWGLGRVIGREHPKLQCTCIDLDLSSQGKNENSVEALTEEILLSDRETQVAYRDNLRYVARLTDYLSKEGEASPAQLDEESVQSCRFSPDGTYLITGGLGGLGLLFARWMVERGARHLILMSRSVPSKDAQKALEALEKRGAKLIIAQADVSRYGDIAQVLDKSRESLPPLRGILHCAGVVEDGVLLNQDWAKFEKVFGAKVFGSFNLHALTQDMQLDFFVLFSSVASLLGLAGQGNHAAANAFMDSLAGYRCAIGLPAISINWGPWSEVGAATKGKVMERIRSQGMEAISPGKGLQIFERILQEAPPQVAVGRMHWAKFLRQSGTGAVPPMFSDVFQGCLQREEQNESELSARPDFGKQLAEAPSARRRGMLLALVTDQVRNGLRLDARKPINLQQPLSELGLDSLLAIELRNHIGLSLGLNSSLPATLLFDYPTLETITDYLAEEVLSIDSPKSPERVKEEDKLLGEIERLSDAEAEALLLAEMSSEMEKN